MAPKTASKAENNASSLLSVLISHSLFNVYKILVPYLIAYELIYMFSYSANDCLNKPYESYETYFNKFKAIVRVS